MLNTENNWFTFLLAIIIPLIAGLGALILTVHNFTMQKLNNISQLFIHERDIMKGEIKCVSDRQEQIKDELRDRIHKVEMDNK